MAWLTKKRPGPRGALDANGDDTSATDWSSDDPTGSIMVVHQHRAGASPPRATMGADTALDGESAAGEGTR
jgi:hypothetical protein